MSRRKISELESATDITGSDLIQVVDVEDSEMAVSGTNKKATAQLLANELGKIAEIYSTGSITARPIVDRFSDTANVLDFGADPSGVSDSSSALSSADSKGKTIIFPKGNYKISSSITVSNPCLILDGAIISPDSGITITFGNVKSDNGSWVGGLGNVITSSSFSPPWGYSTSVKRYARSDTKKFTTSSATQIAPIDVIESVFNGTDVTPSGDLTVPVGLYVQHDHIGTNSTAYTHSIMGYALNSATGDNDVVATSGRATKKSSAGVGDACGVWGSAYQQSTLNGGVMGMETHIYQNVSGSLASDRLGPKWSVGLHVYSNSTGSPATAGIAIDGTEGGNYNFWNGIIIDRNTFNGNGTIGTVGINCGSWDSSYSPQYGIKFGTANVHIYSNTNLSIKADNSIYLSTSDSNTSIFLDVSSNLLSNIVFRSDGSQFAALLGNSRTLELQKMISVTSATTSSTVGAAGGASALPATPSGYLEFKINGTIRKIPYYDT